MNWACPKCGVACGFFAGACSKCGFPLTLGAAGRHYWGRLRTWMSKATAIECPQCHRATPITGKRCISCGEPLTVETAVNVTLAPPRRRWARFKRESSPQTWRRVRWCYLLLSAGVLWGLLAFVEEKHADSWAKYAALSVIYLAVLGFLAAWLAPRYIFFALSRAAPVLKFAFVLNYLSALIVLQLFIAAWWGRALILAGLFVVTWASAFLLCRAIVSAAAETKQVFFGPDQHFDPSASQGRQAFYD